MIDPKLALATLEMKENPLSEREADVLRRFAGCAWTCPDRGGTLLSYGTVRNCLASAVAKIGGRNRMDAVRVATKAGLAADRAAGRPTGWPTTGGALVGSGSSTARLKVPPSADTTWLSAALGIAFIALGLLTAPWLLRRYAALARSFQIPAHYPN